MTITVHSHGKWVVLSRPGACDLKHEVPKKSKFFKEELRLFREEIVAWMCGNICDHLRKALYFAVVVATRRKDGLALITTYEESAHVTR